MKRIILIVVVLFTLGMSVPHGGAYSPAVVPAVKQQTPSAQIQSRLADKYALEMVFVLDTTGSMGGLIDGAKQRIWGIVNGVMESASRPSVRIGLVAYRDRGDAYVTKVLPLTADLDQVYTALMGYLAEGGGDGPENVRRALADAVHSAGWSPRSPGVAQIIFLVGDAPPHDDYQDEPDTAATTAEAVRAGMIVNTIQCGGQPDTQQVWQTIAQHGEGQYFSIAQDGGVQAIVTPYDKRLSELGAKLGSTYAAYGGGDSIDGIRYREEANEKQAVTETVTVTAGTVGAAADRAVNKALNSSAYAGDLMTDLENGTVKLDAVKDADLPDDLKKLEPAARKKEIEKRLAERKKLREEILKLSKQRDDFIADARRKQPDKKKGFDSAVSETLKQQLARKGIK